MILIQFSVDLINCEVELSSEMALISILLSVESRNLIIGGGGGVDEFEAFVSSNERYGSASEDDRNAVSNWLEGRSVVQSVEVSDLVDANYDF